MAVHARGVLLLAKLEVYIMKLKIKSNLLCLVILCALLLFAGCNGTGSAGANCRGEIMPLGGSGGFVLLRHCNGKLYVVDLGNHNAYEVAGLPGLDD